MGRVLKDGGVSVMDMCVGGVLRDVGVECRKLDKNGAAQVL